MITFNGQEFEDEDFLKAYMDQKVKENDERAVRIEMEKALLERYGNEVPEDRLSRQFKQGRFTVAIKRNIRYDLSEIGWAKVWAMPVDERPVKIEYSHTKGRNIPEICVEEIEKETKPSFDVTYK